MSLMHNIFNLIDPERGTNWFSVMFSRWQTDRINKWNDNYRKATTNNPMMKSHYFKAPGGGDVVISNSFNHSCGDAVGFSFDVEWGRFGFCGAVLGRREAKRMAEFILERLATETESEEDQLARQKKEFEEFKEKIRIKESKS